MFPFFFWFILPTLLFLLRNNKSQLLSWGVVLLLIAVAGFRDISFVGDTSNYLTWYEYGEDYFQTGDVEWLYSVINLVAIRNGISFQYIVLLMSTVTVLFNYYAIKRETNNELVGLCLYFCLTFYLYSFNAQRQMCADAILLYSYTFLKNNRVKYFLCFVLLASLFHTSSSIAVLLLFFMIKKDYKIPESFVIITVSLSFLIGGLNITQLFLGNLESLFPKYASNDAIEVYGTSFGLTRFLYSGFFLYIYLSTKDRANMYLKIFYIGILLINLFSYKSAAMRIAYLFTPVQILLFIPLFERHVWTRHSFIVSFYMLFLYYYLTLAQYSALMDYKFCSIASFTNL